ncbi:MAG: DUF4184 family protein [Verrucomicrobiia bacterium]
MPFTGSHPIAVLPLKRWFSETPYFAALVVGSMSPDFGYFSPIDVNTHYSHTLEGMVVMDWPASVLILILVLAIRKSFCQLLPNPHRDFLSSLCVKPNVSVKIIFITLFCLLFGALTHVIWDSFTHGLSPIVKQSIWLRKETELGMPIYRVIQHTSTLVGGLILLLAYRCALKKKGYSFWPLFHASECKRYVLWLIIGALSLGLSFVKNYSRVSSFDEFYNYQVFAFHFVANSIAIGLGAVILTLLTWQFFPFFRRKLEP